VEYFRSKHEAHASRRESKAAALDIKSPPPVDEEEDVPIQSGKKVGNPFDMLEDGDDDERWRIARALSSEAENLALTIHRERFRRPRRETRRARRSERIWMEGIWTPTPHLLLRLLMSTRT